jgi:hypothetical protein
LKIKIKIKIYFFTENIKKGTFSFSFHFIGLVFYWVFQKGMYSLIGGKLEKASSARKN